MDIPRSTTTRSTAARRLAAAGACAVAATTLGMAPASASPDVTTRTTHQTFRLVDEDHGLLYFVNKSRADLCTPERLAFEQAFQVWVDGGAVGNPPAEPAASQQGVAPVRETTRLVDGRQLVTAIGDALPVEAWRLDDEGGGIDCTATDGPGAALFASGPMDLTNRRNVADPLFTGETTLAGVLVDPAGTRWNSAVHYLVKLVNGNFSISDTNRLVRLG